MKFQYKRNIHCKNTKNHTENLSLLFKNPRDSKAVTSAGTSHINASAMLKVTRQNFLYIFLHSNTFCSVLLLKYAFCLPVNLRSLELEV